MRTATDRVRSSPSPTNAAPASAAASAASASGRRRRSAAPGASRWPQPLRASRRASNRRSERRERPASARINRRAVEASRQAQREGDRAARAGAARRARRAVGQKPGSHGELAQQPVDVPEVPQAARPGRRRRTDGRRRGRSCPAATRMRSPLSSATLSAISAAASGLGRAVIGRMVWWTSIIRSRVRWISGGSSCIQRR